jgi:hypothetical protein
VYTQNVVEGFSPETGGGFKIPETFPRICSYQFGDGPKIFRPIQIGSALWLCVMWCLEIGAARGWTKNNECIHLRLDSQWLVFVRKVLMAQLVRHRVDKCRYRFDPRRRKRKKKRRKNPGRSSKLGQKSNFKLCICRNWISFCSLCELSVRNCNPPFFLWSEWNFLHHTPLAKV